MKERKKNGIFVTSILATNFIHVEAGRFAVDLEPFHSREGFSLNVELGQ